MSRMASARELRSFWILKSCSESRRLRSTRSFCSLRRPPICTVMYDEYATTATSVTINPRIRPGVGERWAERCTGRGYNGGAASSNFPEREPYPHVTWADVAYH